MAVYSKQVKENKPIIW